MLRKKRGIGEEDEAFYRWIGREDCAKLRKKRDGLF